MSILVDSSTRVLVQGITGRVGRAQTQYMLAEGTHIVAGVTPGKGGSVEQGVPVFDHVAEAVRECGANMSLLFVPPAVAEAAVEETLAAGVKLLVLITEGIPVHATMRIRSRGEAAGARIIGPATPGVITPRQCKVGIMPARFFRPGPVGIVSRSGTLSYEVSALLSASGIGQSTVVGLGADLMVGTDIIELLRLFDADPQTEVIVLVGEVGGIQEERAARFAAEALLTPLVAYVAGRCAVADVPMGHAGALVREGAGSVADKIAAFKAAQVAVASSPRRVVDEVRIVLGMEPVASSPPLLATT